MRLEELDISSVRPTIRRELRNKQAAPREELSGQAHADWCAEYDRINPTVRRTSAEELLAEIRALRGE